MLNPNLFSSELFGIEARTATGVDKKIGLIEAADGGDLFLDEIADMPAEVQAAVLRVLQERQITRVGGREPKRWTSVSFPPLTLIWKKRAWISLGSARSAPSWGTVRLPPLRERKTDIPLLAESFVREAEAQRRGAISA